MGFLRFRRSGTDAVYVKSGLVARLMEVGSTIRPARIASLYSGDSADDAKEPSWLRRQPLGFSALTRAASIERSMSLRDSVRVLSASERMMMVSYVTEGRLTSERDRRSSI